MTRSFWRTLLALAAVAALLGISACGGDDNESSDSGTPAQSDEGSTASGDKSVTDELFAGTAVDNIADPAQGKKGGKLTVLSGGDVDYMDPGQTYYTYAIGIMNAIHRGLYSYTPGRTPRSPCRTSPRASPRSPRTARPSRSSSSTGVMFSKPVNREVEAKDVKYAHRARLHGQRRRTATPASTSATSRARPKKPGDYQGDPRHRDAGQVHDRPQAHEGHRRGRRGRARRCRSRSRSRRSSRRSTTRRPRRPTATRPRSTPARTWSSPTPRARRSATWPARRIDLVRNPDYAPVDDFRPAYLDEIEFQAGNDDTAVATRRILSGENLARRRHRAARAAAQDGCSRRNKTGALGGAGRRLAHDLAGQRAEPPFDDINVRKAVDRGLQPRRRRASSVAARRSARSPSTTSRRAWPGFEESGGLEGFTDELDWMAKPGGRPRPVGRVLQEGRHAPRASTRATRRS